MNIPLVVCVIGIVLYWFATEKTNKQFAEDVGRIAFGVALLVVLLTIARGLAATRVF